MLWPMKIRQSALTLSTLLLLACGRASTVAPTGAGSFSATQGGESQAAPRLRVRWLGGPTATLERGGLRVLTDPMLGPRGDNAFTLPKHPSSGALNALVARY